MNSTEGSVDPDALTVEEFYQLLDIYFWVQGVFYSVIGFTGVIANILNIIALSRTLKTATYKIFLAMAAADLMVTLVVLTYSLTFCVYDPPKILLGTPPNLNEGVTYSMYVWMNLWFHIANLFACVSNWCAVLVAVFRLVVISFPLKASEYASDERVNAAIAAIYVLSMVGQLPGWIAYRFDKDGAITANALMVRFINISVVIGGPAPFLICSLTTLALVIQLARYQIQIKSSISKQQIAERKKAQKSLTLTLILVLFHFLITTLPLTAYWIMENTNYFDTHGVSTFKKTIFLLVSSACSLIHSATNFFIYIFANKSFRDNLRRVICFHKRSRVAASHISSIHHRTNASTRTTETHGL